MNGTVIDWAFRIGAGIAALAATLLLAWALVADRPRGRRRCPRCWYSMDAVASRGAQGSPARCPECGHVPASDRALFRTRRHWRWVPLAAVLGVTSYSLAVAPAVRAHGWTSAIPNTVLVGAWPVPVSDWVAKNIDGDVVTNAMVDEIDARIEGHSWTPPSPYSCFGSPEPANRFAAWQINVWHDRVVSELRDEGRYDIERERPVLRALSSTRMTRSIDTERFADAVRILEKDLGVTIIPDWKRLEEHHVTPDKLVSISLVSATGGDALSKLLRAAGVDRMSPVQWRVEGDRVVIDPWDPETAGVPVVSYDLAPFVTGAEVLWQAGDGDDAPMEERVRTLVRIITGNVDPESWVDGGGDVASYTIMGNNLMVRAPAGHHVAIDDLLSKFRHAIDQTEGDASWRETASLHGRLARTTMKLSGGPVSVASVATSIGSLTDIPVEADWAGLAAIRVLPELQVDLALDSTTPTMVQVLDTLVAALVPDPLDGVAWTIHTGAVRIGPAEEIDSLVVTRVYNTRRISDDVHRVRHALYRGVDPDAWFDAGGDGIGAMEIGPLLCIRTTARRHLRIAALLADPEALAKHMPAGEITGTGEPAPASPR